MSFEKYFLYFPSPLHHYNCGENVSELAASCSAASGIKTNIFIIEFLISSQLYIEQKLQLEGFLPPVLEDRGLAELKFKLCAFHELSTGKTLYWSLLAIHFIFLSLLCHGLVSLIDMTSGLSVYTETCKDRNS